MIAIIVFRDGITRIFDFNGYSCRGEFWVFQIEVLILCLLLERMFGQTALALAILVFFLPLLSNATRRLRDAGTWPWFALLGFFAGISGGMIEAFVSGPDILVRMATPLILFSRVCHAATLLLTLLPSDHFLKEKRG